MSLHFPLHRFLYLLFLALAAGLGSCAPVSGYGSPSSISTAALTPAAQGARATRSIAFPPTATSEPAASRKPESETKNPRDLASQTPALLPSQLPSAAVLRTACDKAAPGSPIDVTIIDSTRLDPGQPFTKIWRLVNAGQCKWTTKYAAEWFSGDKLGNTQVVALGTNIPPGESLDILVDMVAPLKPGTYQSNWKLRNAAGEWFGIGPDGDQVFWVKIVVIQTQTETPAPTSTEIPPSLTPTLTATSTLSPSVTSTITPAITATLTLTPTLTPAAQASGPAALVNGDGIDLDTLLLNSGGEDLSFQQDENSNHWLVPVEPGVLGVFGIMPPTLQACQAANMSSARIPIESLAPGTYLCFRSGQGYPGWARYDNLNPHDNTLGLNILTWTFP